MSALDETELKRIGTPRALLARMIRPLILSVAGGIAVYVAIVLIGDRERIFDAIGRIDSVGWLVLIGFSVANYFFRFLRWHWYITVFGGRVPFWRDLWIYLAGFAFVTSPGKAGEAVRSIYLLPYGVPMSASLAAFMIERYMDLLAILALSMLTALHFEESRWLLALAAVAAVVLFSVYRGTWMLDLIEAVARTLGWSFLKRGLAALRRFQRDAATLLRARVFYGALAIGLVAWAAEGVGFSVMLDYLAVDIALPTAIGIYSISILAGAMSFIPGGIGSAEAVMTLLLVLMGVDTMTAVSAAIICRLATLWLAVLIGMVALALLEATGASTKAQAEAAS